MDSRESKTVTSLNDTVIQKALEQLKTKYPDIITGANVSAQKPEADGSTKYVCRNTFTVSYKEAAVQTTAARTAEKTKAAKTAAASSGTQSGEKQTVQTKSAAVSTKTIAVKKSGSVQKEDTGAETIGSESTENITEPAETAPEKATSSNL